MDSSWLNDALKRKKIQDTWSTRMEKIGRPAIALCEEYGFHPSAMCRHLKGKHIVSRKTLEKMETMIKKELEKLTNKK